MEIAARDIDLIEDIWTRILGSLDYKQRALIFLVCKQWKARASRPLIWKTLDVVFPNYKEPKLSKIIKSFCQFVSKYCSLTTHVRIEKEGAKHFWPIMSALSSLRQLQYLKVTCRAKYSADISPADTFQKPDWPNLIHLNLDLPVNTVANGPQWRLITEGAPNVEELCVNEPSWRKSDFVSGLMNLRKLKILYATHNQTEEILNQIPYLQALVLKSEVDYPPLFIGPDSQTSGEFQYTGLQYNGNTIVLNRQTLLSRDLETVKKIGHILKKTNYAYYFAQQTSSGFNAPLLKYLFEELKLDVNCCTTHRQDPFAIELLPVLSPPITWYPLTSVLHDVDQVRMLLDLGADPNYLDEGDSPNEREFSPLGEHSLSKDSCILLLERGTNPLKRVNRDNRGECVIARLFTKFGDEDMIEVINTAVNGGLDVNQIVDGPAGTLLDLATARQYKRTVLELLQLGARWTPQSIDQLIRWDIDWCTDVIRKGEFDASKVLLSTALFAIKRGLYPLVREYLHGLTSGLDEENGFSFVHYISLCLQNTCDVTPNHFSIPISAAEKELYAQLLGQMIKELNLDVNMKTAEGKTPLLLVCADERDSGEFIAKVLIEFGANVNEPDRQGWTPLHAACYGAKYDIAKLLLSHGANINAQDKLGITPVMTMALMSPKDEEGNLDFFRAIEFDVTQRDKYAHRSILHYLAAVGCLDELDVLFDKMPELDVDCRDAHGFTPLHYAALVSHNDAMKLLVERGADVNATSYTLGLTPIMLSLIDSGHPYHRYRETLVNLCVTTGQILPIYVGIRSVRLCSVQVAVWHVTNQENGCINNFGSSSEDRSFFPWPTNLSLNDQFGNNLLHYLVSSHHVTRMIEQVPEYDKFQELWSKPNKRGTTPFHIFARNYDGSTPAMIPDFLIAQQHELLYSLNNRDEHGRTALEYFLGKDSLEVASALPKIPGIKFTTAIIESSPMSLLHSSVTLTKEIIARASEADPNALNLKINGKTPLMVYLEKMRTEQKIYNYQNELLDAFLECKMDLDLQDNEGNTALHHACYFFHLGAWDYCYARHWRYLEASYFSVPLFKLLEAGARVDIKNNEGKTALDILPNLLQLDSSIIQLVKSNDIKRC